MEIRILLILKGALLCAGLFFFFVVAYLFYSIRSKANAAISVAIIVIAGLILRYVLPGLPSMFITRKEVQIVLPLNRLVFWFCLSIGLLGTSMTMAKAMVYDFGIPQIDQLLQSQDHHGDH